MLFTSLNFLLFFITVYICYWMAPGRFRRPLLLVASLIFYTSWSLPFMVHFGTIILINFALNRKITKANGAHWLYLSLFINGANLFLFKYFYFGLEILNDLTGISIFSSAVFNSWLNDTFGLEGVILPLAISFYTFQLTAYSIDLKRGVIERPFSLAEFSLFILFFPQLIAGPIMRYSDFAGQLRNIDSLKPEHDSLTGGLYLLLTGLIKKLMIANNLIPFQTAVFQNPSAYDWSSLVLACLSFSSYLYCDFSGYTDLARGLGKLLGLQLPENFFAPYFSTSLSKFWSNWHRTLTVWLRDYIYIPLGGSHGSFFRSEFNIFITMLIIGLWHGASYNFFLLGLMHGILITIESTYLRLRKGLSNKTHLNSDDGLTLLVVIRKFSGALMVFTLLNLGFVLFQTPDFAAASKMYERMFSLASGEIADGSHRVGSALLMVLLFHLLQLYRPSRNLSPAWRYTLLTVAGVLFLFKLVTQNPVERDFFYFQF